MHHHIDNQTYEKTLRNQTNFDQTVLEEIRKQAKLAVKDEYTFDFLCKAKQQPSGQQTRNSFPVFPGDAFLSATAFSCEQTSP